MNVHLFPNASEAAIAVALYASQNPKHQFELTAVFNGEREIIGFHARIKDQDGFGLGYVGKGGKAGS